MITINTLTAIPDSEFSRRFAQWMYDRMGMSFFKYGLVADAYPHKVDAIASLKKRLEKYEETGNAEYLVDVANFAMIETMRPRHPKAHFKAEDSGASPGRVWNTGEQTSRRNTAEDFAYRRDGD